MDIWKDSRIARNKSSKTVRTPNGGVLLLKHIVTCCNVHSLIQVVLSHANGLGNEKPQAGEMVLTTNKTINIMQQRGDNHEALSCLCMPNVDRMRPFGRELHYSELQPQFVH